MKVLIINGPNLNCLGKREPEVYGSKTLSEIQSETSEKLKKYKIQSVWFQSNIEGEIVTQIQSVIDSDFSALVINPGAYSHTSVAILDALSMLSVPIVEVHMSNTHRRENFRHTKLTAKSSTIIMEGLGNNAYFMGAMALIPDQL